MLNAQILYRSRVFLRLLGIVLLSVAPASRAWSEVNKPELITFMNGDLALKGFLWKPEGPGPFPAILWNHGSEKRPGKLETVAPFFVSRGYVFFVPHRRGQGRSPGPYIMDQLNASGAQRSRMLVTLHDVQFHDQLAALDYLKHLPYVDEKRLVVAGVSFGGIQTILAAERGAGYRVAVDCSGAAQSWKGSVDLRVRLTAAARNAKIPVFFLQAENDYDLTPNRILSEEVRRSGKFAENKTYPAFGSGAKGQEGHKFCWRGTDIWGPDVLSFIESNLNPGQR